MQVFTISQYQQAAKRTFSKEQFVLLFLLRVLLTANKANALSGPYLQCTTIGPASGGLQVLTLRKKARKGVGCSGTP